MKKITTIIFISLIILISIFSINYPLSKNNVYGKYVNKNFNQPICCVEAPHKPDTLILSKNGKFQSAFYGKGNYKFDNGFEAGIELHYFEFGKSAIYRTYLENKIFEKPRIVLNADTNHYYEKIE